MSGAERVTATLAFRLPRDLRTGTPDAGWNATQPTSLAATSFLEGPSFDAEGHLWFVDIVNGRILRLDDAGEVRVEAEYDGWPNGLKIHTDGRVFIADHKNGIMVYERDTRRIAPLLERYGEGRFKGVNDLFFADKGDLYFTARASPACTTPRAACSVGAPKARSSVSSITSPAPMGS